MSPKLQNFLKRLSGTAILLALLAGVVAAVICDHGNLYYAGAFVCLLCSLAGVEWFFMLRGKERECNRPLILVGTCLYPWLLMYLLPPDLHDRFDAHVSSCTHPLLALVVYALAAFVCELVRLDYGKQNFAAALRSLGTSLLAFIYPGWLFAFALLAIHRNELAGPILFIVVLSKLSDIWAYLCGVLLGRRLIPRSFSPAVSPNKSWEGIIGSFLLTTLCFMIVPLCWGDPCLGPGNGVLLAAFLTLPIFLLAVVGDLVGSLIKRGLGVKDSGHLIPGIGGVIDLIDSPSLAVPLFTLLACVLL